MRALTALLLLGAAACVDVQDGDMGFYEDPCGTSYQAALLCGRESGGADPQRGGPAAGGGAEGPPTTSCEDVCELLAACVGITDPQEIAQCVVECQAMSTPEQRQCIIANGCNFQVCFDDSPPPPPPMPIP
jgi:hypothetical protein